MKSPRHHDPEVQAEANRLLEAAGYGLERTLDDRFPSLSFKRRLILILLVLGGLFVLRSLHGRLLEIAPLAFALPTLKLMLRDGPVLLCTAYVVLTKVALKSERTEWLNRLMPMADTLGTICLTSIIGFYFLFLLFP